MNRIKIPAWELQDLLEVYQHKDGMITVHMANKLIEHLERLALKKI